MEILRTPDERFDALPEYPFVPHYAQLGELRMHYVDQGPCDGAPVLMLHGEPSWSYLYRKMIPPFAAAGYRALVPDLIGFGKSDKPAAMTDYSYQAHIDWLVAWIEQLDLKNITLICQDWGSMLGLRIAAEHGERFARIVVANGFLPPAWQPSPLVVKIWRAFAAYSPWFPIGRIIALGCVTKLTPAQIAAYDAPYPDNRYKAGARAFPYLVPMDESNPAVPANRAAWDQLGLWQKPFLTVFGKNDPMLGSADKPLQEHVPGARGQPHQRVWGGHFIQEDRGDELARIVLEWFKA
ncbi:MAG: putative haloalkane dehalogenase [Pedosphaera sp.]|nr:putative haloalkane dehalogenase [Pedosphaera sp.]